MVAHVARRLAGTREDGVRALCDLEVPAVLQRWADDHLAGRLTPSAVMVALVERTAGPTVLLTRRAGHLRSHPAQISFPGGRRDATDPSYTATALREAHEEVGLSPATVNVIGYLDDYPTLTGYRITPVVAHVPHPPAAWQPAAEEVDEVFELPLQLALELTTYRQGNLRRNGIRLPFYEMDYQGHRIWGATAGILRVLAQQVGRPT